MLRRWNPKRNSWRETKNRWLALFSLQPAEDCGNKNNSRRPFWKHAIHTKQSSWFPALWEVWIISKLHWEPRLLLNTPSSSFRQVSLFRPTFSKMHKKQTCLGRSFNNNLSHTAAAALADDDVEGAHVEGTPVVQTHSFFNVRCPFVYYARSPGDLRELNKTQDRVSNAATTLWCPCVPLMSASVCVDAIPSLMVS